MPVAQLPLLVQGFSAGRPPRTLELSQKGELGQVITFEEEKARNRSGPALTLIIWLVKVFSCNNALLGLSLSPPVSYYVAAHCMYLCTG